MKRGEGQETGGAVDKATTKTRGGEWWPPFFLSFPFPYFFSVQAFRSFLRLLSFHPLIGFLPYFLPSSFKCISEKDRIRASRTSTRIEINADIHFCLSIRPKSKLLLGLMGSEQNDGTSYQPSEPKPCANNCGFFGTAGTMNLCSKCYRDFRIKEEQAASAKAAMEISLNLKPQQPNNHTIESSIPPKGIESLSVPSSSSASPANLELGAGSVEPKAANRCSTCNKKVGLTGFVCKCGCTFCGNHRYPEKHRCMYDFKGAGRDAISKANPIVKADKVERF